MKLLLCLLTLCTTHLAPGKELAFKVRSESYKNMSIILATVDSNQALDKVARVIKNDLQLSAQCTVTTQKFSKIPSTQEVGRLSKQGHPLILFLNNTHDDKAIEWRLYETHSHAMVKGRKYIKKGTNHMVWGHHISDGIWPDLTGQDGCFSTKIAYCKEVKSKKGKQYKHVYMIDMDGNNERVLVKTPTITVAPRWNADSKHPLLFYSECTNSNVRMMVTSFKGESKMASDFDGLNMLPAFSADGSKVVYCASRGNGSCQIYQFCDSNLKKLTHNEGTNVSPTFGPDGYLFFCSDFQTGSPLLYSYEFATEKVTPITHSGFCASPCYSNKTNKIVYAKLIEGYTQLFTYDVATKMHTQLTFDKTSKEECSWSPCGSYIAYCNEGNGKSQIKVMHLKTRSIKDLTPADQICTYPTWSGPLGDIDQIPC